MYLVSADKYNNISQTPPPPSPSYVKTKTKSRKLPLKKRRQHPYDKWVRFRERIQETNIKREALIKEFAEFLKKVLPKDKSHQQEQEQVIPKIELLEQTPQRRFEVPSTSDTKDIYVEIASPFLSPGTRLLDTQYGIRKDGDTFKIGNSTVIIDNMSNLSIKGKQFQGTEDLWKLLTHKNVNYNSIDKNGLQKYKTDLEMTNAHLEGYKEGGNIQRSRGIKFRNVIAKLFPEAKVTRGNSG